MPIYEYQCQSCGKHFEHIQKITDKPLATCTFCKGKVKKLVSNCSFQLKGTGWYVTDYSGKSDNKEEKKVQNNTDKTEKPQDKPATDKTTTNKTGQEKAVNQ